MRPTGWRRCTADADSDLRIPCPSLDGLFCVSGSRAPYLSKDIASGALTMSALGRGQSGFAAVDAITALAILATTIALSISALSVGRRAAMSAAETEQAQTSMLALLDQSVPAEGVSSGSLSDFDWSIAATPTERSLTPVSVCRVDVSLRSRISGRRYRFFSHKVCSAPVSAP